MKKYFLLLLTVFIASCGKDPLPDEGDKGPLPKITWVMSSGRFTIEAGETIQLVPDIENLDETSTYVWTIEGKVVGHDNYYTFTSNDKSDVIQYCIITGNG